MFRIKFFLCICGLSMINGNLFDYSKNGNRRPAKLNAYKVALTQLGYIQFLRYELNVPEINEFTYCIWMKSTNLSHPHPLLSYSYHEHDRLIRGWISDRGTKINLAILEEIAHKIPVLLKEHVWYHICQSWDSFTGYSSLHLNGKLFYSAYNKRVHKINVPAHGDIVIGQEYTDFDKGLEDGIEGFVYGFNMILESIFMKNNPNIGGGVFPTELPPTGGTLKKQSGYNDLISVSRLPSLPINGIHNEQLNAYGLRKDSAKKHFGPIYDPDDDISFRLNLLRRNHVVHKTPSNIIMEMMTNLRPPRPHRKFIRDLKQNVTLSRRKRYANEGTVLESLPLGVQLIEMGYKNCLKGRGGPLTGEKVLINWSQTTVRVFGGAIMKPIKAACGDF